MTGLSFHPRKRSQSRKSSQRKRQQALSEYVWTTYLPQSPTDPQVKNADGSTTTRTANGTKTTRPTLKRNPGSGPRLATVAVNNNAASKIAPLTRTKTSESGKLSPDEHPCASAPLSSPPFASSIYCSPDCAAVEQHRTAAVGKDLARTFTGYDTDTYHHRRSVDGIVTNIDIQNPPYGPPSPLFVSSDTESSNSIGTAPDAGPASSAPKMMEYFRMPRQGPDDAWNEVQRQRRSSMNPNFRPADMVRQNTQTSQYTSGMSSDSLSSMWDSDLYLGRSTSNPGRMRMTPLSHPDEVAISSGPSPIPARPSLPRSNLSHTSLAASSPKEISLLQSYADALPIRHGLSTSYNQRPFAMPGSIGMPITSPPDSRRASMAGVRPSYGTIRAKSRQASGPTWDSLGKDAVREQTCRNKRCTAHASPALTGGLSIPQSGSEHADHTPRQSLRVENGQWKVVHSMEGLGLGKNGTIRSKNRSSSRSTQSSNSSSEGAEVNKQRSASAAASSLMPPPSAFATTASSPSSILTMRSPQPVNTPTTARPSPSGVSLPRSGYSWKQFEEKGGKTLPLPANLHVSNTKAGLFYFQ